MDPITINVKVGLEDETLRILTALVTAAARSDAGTPEQKAATVEQKPAPVEQEPAPVEQPKPKRQAKKEPAPAPVQEAEAEPAAEKIEDMPAEICGAREITDAELRAVITETRQRLGSAQPIKALLTGTYGVKISVETPQEKRAALIEDLKRL